MMKSNCSIMKLSVSLIGIFVILVFMNAGANGGTATGKNTLTITDRIECQRAIEKIYWKHMLWPADNSGLKPEFESIMPDSIIAGKVTDTLRKSQALEFYWQRPIIVEQLQAEMERMAKNTMKPAVLQEIWFALHNEPYLIAECVGRPLLSDRLIRNWYAYDERFHGELRERIQNEIKNYPGTKQIKLLSGEYNETIWIKESGQESEANQLLLNKEEWDTLVKELASEQQLHEDAENFYVRAILEQSANRIKTASVVWKKQSFDEWWSKVKGTLSLQVTEQQFNYRLPVIASYACTNDTWTPTLDRLVERYGHTAVWTGTEMIIWGGKVPGAASGFTDVGGRYNPATDTWTYTSVTGVPAGRYYHKAVWTGSEMIVWGGYNNTVYLNTGGRYNPTSNTWSTLSATGVPAIRAYHTAIWTGSEMIVWGGYSGGTNYLNTGGRYNPTGDTWTATNLTNTPAIRAYHSAVWTGTEMIVWGGFSGGTTYLNTGGLYNPGTDSWAATATTNAPTVRQNHTAVWAQNSMIIWGGYNGTSYLNTGKSYDPSSDTWGADTPTTGAPIGRQQHTAVISGNEMIIWGGYNSGYLNTGGMLSFSVGTWTATSLTNVPAYRRYHSALWSGTEMIVWGGSNQEIYLGTGGRFNPASNSWIPIGLNNTPTSRYSHTSVWTGTEMVIWGGYNGATYFNTGSRYNPATDTWTAITTTGAPTARYYHTAVWLSPIMYVWGGNASGTYTDTGGRLNVAADIWATMPAGGPTARYLHTAVNTGTEMILWGGYDYLGSDVNSGARYIFAGSTWAATPTSGAPAARSRHSAVWDGAEMIVWGGTPATNTGGKLIPTTGVWSSTNLTGAPIARSMHTAVWSGSEMIIWGGTPITNTGGRYTPGIDSWIPASTTNAPSARYSHVAIWTGSEMIIWGGFNGTVTLNTGGRYTPGTDSWIATSTTNVPSTRYYHSVIWADPEMIVWGGSSPTLVFNTGGRYCTTTTGGTPPGAVPDNDNYAGTPLTISKSGTNLQLNWGAPGGTCQTQDYGVYRGSLPWTAYNHASLNCSTGGATSISIAADTGSYYYLTVAQNNNKEGSYGLDSTNAQRPAAASPCKVQEIGTCN